jgi:hypothetical protein
MATTPTASTTIPKTQPVPERSTRTYSATLSDQDGVALEPSQVTSILYSLRDDRSDAIVNGRARVQVLQANGGALATGGAFTLVLTSADMQAVGTSKLQKRRLLLEIDYEGGHENHEVLFWVENLEDIPQVHLGDAELWHLSDTLSASLA